MKFVVIYNFLMDKFGNKISEKEIRLLADLISHFTEEHEEHLILNKDVLKRLLKSDIFITLPEKLKVSFDKSSEFSKKKNNIIVKTTDFKMKTNDILDEFIIEIAKAQNTTKIIELIENIKIEELRKELTEEFVVSLKATFKDELTGTLNKTFFLKTITPYPEKTRRKKDFEFLSKFLESLIKHNIDGIMYIDAANFKKINDDISHDSGDALLKLIGKELSNLNPQLLIRVGGDEFIVMDSYDKLQRIRKEISPDSEFQKKIDNFVKNEAKKYGVNYDLKKYRVFLGSGIAKIEGLGKFYVNKKGIEKSEDVKEYYKIMQQTIWNAEQDMKENKLTIKKELGTELVRGV